ncbi:LysR family transcriptional regulator [Prosthecomicrobium sp. N25]|uniref:LysR family transcriptional regulator n=1 Tax=Prosthecomicrobium sp. N25 TaxID=3129254 RepID=UPI00307897D3
MLTLRQIEVIRAVMIAGTLAGAARLLGVSAPGISRLMKYTERSLRVKLFERIQNRYYPTKEAEDIFEQINGVYKKVDDLQYVLQQVDRGAGILFRIASVPSLSHFVVPNALKRLREKFPALGLDLDIIKVQEAQDYLLLGKCELAVLSYAFEHPGIEVQSLGVGELRCVVPRDHPLAASPVVSVAEIARYPLVGVVPEDPYGRIMMDVFRRHGLGYDLVMSVRFGVTTIGLVRAGIGVALIDQFAAPDASELGVRVLRIREPTTFEPFVAMRAHRPLSRHAAACLQLLREEIRRETRGAAVTSC